MKHQAITGVQAMHQWCFVSPTDPALDPANDVDAGKAWLDTNVGRLKFRNDTNTAWQLVGAPGDLP